MSSLWLTWICSVSMLGKHLRIVGSILQAVRTPKRTWRSRIVTAGNMTLGFTIVLACDAEKTIPMHSTTQLLRGKNTLASNIAQARRPMDQRREMQSKHLDDGVADLKLVPFLRTGSSPDLGSHRYRCCPEHGHQERCVESWN